MKNTFIKKLNSASDLQSLAALVCAYIEKSGFPAKVHCIWQLASTGSASGRHSYPVMPAQEITAIEKTAQHDINSGHKLPVYLAQQHNAFFIIHTHCLSPLSKEQKTFLLATLNSASLQANYLLAKLHTELQEFELESSKKLQKALFDISNLSYLEQDSQTLFRKLHEVIGSLVYAENFFIVRFNRETESMHFLYYEDSIDHEDVDPEVEFDKNQMAGSITLAMLRSKKPAWGSSNSLLEKFKLDPDLALGPDSIDWVGIPMLDGEDVVGGIIVQSYLPEKRYNQMDLNLLSFVAEHIRQSLTRREYTVELESKVNERTAKLSQEIHERERSENIQSALFNITRLASQTDSLDLFYPAMHEIVSQLLEAKNIYVAFIDETNKTLNFPYRVDELGESAKSRPISNGLTEWVLASRAPVLLNESQISRLKAQNLAVVKGNVPKCWLGVPLIINDKSVGIIALQSYDNIEAYSYKEQELLMFVSTHIAQALEKIETANRLKTAYSEMESNVLKRTQELELSNKALREQILRREEAEQKLKHDALHDSLTGLANRNQLYIRLNQSLALHQAKPSHLFAVFFIDLDRFKVINDSMGHWVGDELLKIVAERIQRCVRKPDLVARLGGDEFAVILNSIRNINEARMVADRMLVVFNEPVYIQGKELFVSPSIGIAISHGRHKEPDEILRDADIALYRSKELGRNRFTFFDDALHQSSLNTLIIEGDLRRAITRGEIFPHYQAIFELKTQKILGFEALMRWQHPERGILSPKDFSDIAKETGLIEQVDWQMYEQVCRDLPILLGIAEYISINVSPRHLGHENFANRMLALIAEYGVNPTNIKIEVTEDALIEHPELGLKLLTQLKQAGIQIKLDDFGTGYSSFSYLHRYPLDCLKIDHSFIKTLSNSPDNKTVHLLSAIYALGISLGLEMIVEGIETQEQSICLQHIGFISGQGHLFAMPASIEEICATFKLAPV
ncbi:MAG TPA: EAL domain-containing protein [Arenimonas sp.]|nr:EAL domain-containing protein [Arenimonas sp.]